jgi:hypothetical protein
MKIIPKLSIIGWMKTPYVALTRDPFDYPLQVFAD